MNKSSLINFILKLYSLKRIPRIGWLIAGIPKCSVESVSDHSYFVTLLAYFLSFYLEDIDALKLIKLALIHDLSEAIVHDIGGKARELIPREVRKSAEYTGLRDIIPEELNEMKSEILALWREYEEGKSREAKIVKILDKLELMFQALDYAKLFSKVENLAEFFSDIDKIINESDNEIVRNLAMEIKSRFINENE